MSDEQANPVAWHENPEEEYRRLVLESLSCLIMLVKQVLETDQAILEALQKPKEVISNKFGTPIKP